MKTLTIAVLLLFMSYHSYAQVYNNVTIYTPSNVAVGALQLVSGDLTSTQKTQSKNFWLSCYNNRISYISEATYSYNCHAYAWYTTEGGSNVWINDPEDDDFWGDFGYVEVVNQSSADKVSFGGPCYQYWTTCLGTSYTNPCDHSAITTTTTDYFISKWGAAPLFRHHKDDCPYSTQDIHYYAKLEISGPTILCSSGGSYTISNLPSGSTITWNNGSFVTRQSAQGSNPCTFVSSGHGSTWISATINFGGGGPLPYLISMSGQVYQLLHLYLDQAPSTTNMDVLVSHIHSGQTLQGTLFLNHHTNGLLNLPILVGIFSLNTTIGLQLFSMILMNIIRSESEQQIPAEHQTGYLKWFQLLTAIGFYCIRIRHQGRLLYH